MKKYIGVTALIFLLLQFSMVAHEFSMINVSTIIESTEGNRTVNDNFIQKSGLDSISAQNYYGKDTAFLDVEENKNTPKLSRLVEDSGGTVQDESLSSDDYHRDYLLDDFWNRYRGYLIAGAFVTIILVLHGVLSQRMRKLNYSLVKGNEEMLRNITNNINGGVLVFYPQKGFQISYVNDGFLKLIGYSKEELSSINAKEYFRFIHPEDRPQLEKMIMPESAEEEQGNEFSMSLRIRRKNGKYLPTLVNGSLVRNEQGEKELFCVIMDISREHSVLEELKFEQERHRILLEKSDEILYEINYEEHTVKVSPKFKEKFGWSLPKRFFGKAELDLFQVYDEDRPEFVETLNDISSGKIDGELTVRICKIEGTPCWCKIIYHVMRGIDGEKIRLIGKISDIDIDMREKQLLMKKAQVDALTGLYNKDAFRTNCVEYLSKFSNSNSAVVFFDVDNFKDINDSLGHAAGDKALSDISRKIQLVFSKRDILGRFGGDEFCVLVKNVGEEKLIRLLDRMLEELRLEYRDEHQTVSASVSIGAVLSSEFGSDFDQLLECADKAQYFAKRKGKDSYVLYNNDLSLKVY